MNPKTKALILLSYANALLDFASETLNTYKGESRTITEVRNEFKKSMYPNQQLAAVKRCESIDFSLEQELEKEQLELTAYLYLIVDLLGASVSFMPEESKLAKRIKAVMMRLISYRDKRLTDEQVSKAQNVSDKIISILGIDQAA